jgi:hypothetical protein
MKNNAKKAKSAASIPTIAAQQSPSIDNSGMDNFRFLLYICFVYKLVFS